MPVPEDAAPKLELVNVSRSFGGVAAVKDISLTVARQECRGIVGPNGAGKTTLFNLITGFLAPDRGEIRYDGTRINRLPPYRRAELRISIVFQASRLFRGMTAAENVMVGAHRWTHGGLVTAACRLPRHRREERKVREAASAALERTGLGRWAETPAGLLPFGMQRSLQVARALCADPAMLLLDEPASGLRAGEREDLAALLGGLKTDGLTLLLVEHDVAFVSQLADAVTVLNLGAVLAEGPPRAVFEDPRVVEAYIGGVQGAA